MLIDKLHKLEKNMFSILGWNLLNYVLIKKIVHKNMYTG